jgi:hypothetical protein
MTKKIVILKRKKLLLGTAVAAAGILLAVLLLLLLRSDNGSSGTFSLEDSRYLPGMYTSDIVLNDFILHLELAVDRDCIKAIRITNIDEAVSAMYPLVEPSLLSVSEQLISGIDIDSVTVSEDSKFTQMLLIEAIRSTLDKAVLAEGTEATPDN